MLQIGDKVRTLTSNAVVPNGTVGVIVGSGFMFDFVVDFGLMGMISFDAAELQRPTQQLELFD